MKRGILSAFTIIELLVIIVVIGVLAAITIVSYSGLTSRAITASLKTDLTNASRKLQLYYVDHNSVYPASMTDDGNGNYCPTPEDTKYCTKASSGNTLIYVSSSPYSAYTLTASNPSANGSYMVTNESPIVALTAPVVSSPAVDSITSTSANLGANLISTGGSTVTALGTCWGASPNPTTNCTSLPELGSLTALSPTSISTGTNAWPRGLVISNDGKSVYASNSNNTTLSMYSRNTTTGLLTALSPATISAGTGPIGVAISTNGESLYVANHGSNNISMYSRNTTTGLLTALSPATISAGTGPHSIVVSSDGNFVYCTNAISNNISMYSRNTTTGLLTALSPATISAGTYPRDIVIAPDGSSVYVVNSTSNNIYMYSRDPVTGTLTGLSTPTIATGSQPRGVTISSDGKSVYVGNAASGNLSIYKRNISTGVLSPISPSTVSGVSWPWFLAVSNDGKSVYVANNVSTSTISMYSRNDINESFNTGSFTHIRTGLPTGALVYYRGYATNSIGTSYSEDGSFSTP